MKNLTKITIIILCLALSNINAYSQKLGYGFFTPNTQFALAGQTVEAVATLQAGFDMGVGLYLNDNLGLYAGFGAYRSIRSFNNIERDQNNSKDHTESGCGPKVFLGLDWFVLPEKKVCPILSIYGGYRYLISSFHDEPLYDTEGLKKGIYNKEDSGSEFADARYIPVIDYSWFGTNYKSIQHSPDGFFFGLKAGTNFKLKDFAINVSVSYELSQFHDGAIVGDSQERFGYFDYVNGVPSYRPWSYYNYINDTPSKMPFARKFRSLFGFSVSFVI